MVERRDDDGEIAVVENYYYYYYYYAAVNAPYSLNSRNLVKLLVYNLLN